MSRRQGIFGLALGAALLAGCPVALAGPDACLGIARQLDLLNSQAAGYTDPTLNDSIFSQRQELDLATVEARRSGCIGGAFFRQTPAPSCATLMPAIATMEANLQRLNDQRRMGPQALRDQRTTLLAQLDANGCGGLYDVAPRPRSALASLFANEPTNGVYDGSGADLYDPSGREDSYVRIEGYGDTYRTLCVRTCDGYYFPISFSTEPSRFSDDAQACAAACPGAEVSLFVHHTGEEVEQMVSLSGQPYSSLPTAFAYRRSYNAACTCRAQQNAGGFTPVPKPAKAAPAGAPPKPEASAEAKRDVRVVGPSYYVAQ